MKKSKFSAWIICATAVILTASPLLAQQNTVDPTEAAWRSAIEGATNADESSRTTQADADQTESVTDATGNGPNPQPVVLMGQNYVLKSGETAREVVVIGGNAILDGKVEHDAVVIMGNLLLNGEVGGDTVAVLGSIQIGTNGVAGKDAVAVLGSLALSPGAVVEHDAVSVLGSLVAPDGAIVRGSKVNVGFPANFPKFEWLREWFKYCLVQMRPLAPQVEWVWAVYGVFFLLSLFIAAVFPRPVGVCVEAIETRPATTFLLGLLTQLLAPIAYFILIATGIGFVVVPFLWAALFLGTLVGKIAIRQWIGFRIGRVFGAAQLHPVIGFLIGSVLVTLLYMVPVLGMITYLLLGMWGIGCAVSAGFGSMQRESGSKSTPGAPGPIPPAGPEGKAPQPMPVAAPLGNQPEAASGLAGGPPSEPPRFATGSAPGAAPSNASVGGPAPAPSPIASMAQAWPSAGFWERMGAGFLDIVIVGILAGLAAAPLALMLPIVGPSTIGFAIALAYFSGLWAWKGATLGGIVLKLQVVRTDGGPLTFPVCLVRALTAALSVIVLFLGFLWIIWDKDKQGWHDKIAGTEVVRLPRSVPLICL